MKKQILLIASLFIAIGTFAQNGITNAFRFGQGEDSIKCIEAISLYNVNLQNKNYAAAYPEWKKVFTNYPVARVDTYTKGEQLLKALIAATTDEAKKAKYSYIVAALMFKQGKISQCRQYCRKSLQFNPSNGDAYLLQASCIVRIATGDHLQKSYYYCLATDYCNRAKAVDPATAAKANRQAATYASYYYPKSEAFFAGIKAGQKVNVAGETTTLRLR